MDILLCIIFAMMCLTEGWCLQHCHYQTTRTCNNTADQDQRVSSKESASQDYPGTKQDAVVVTPVLNGIGLPGIHVTWKHTMNVDKSQSYEIRYWNYTSSEDPYNFSPYECYKLNITRQSKPSDQTMFYHDCTEGSTKLISVSTISNTNEHTDYFHRITKGYRQDYGEDSVSWKSPLIVVHNDSCAHKVHIQAYLAPAKFKFRKYRLVVKDIHKDGNDVLVRDYKKLHPGQRMIDHTFSDVPDGAFTINLYPEFGDPLRDRKKCRCKSNTCGRYTGCATSKSAAFLITSNHKNCNHQKTITQALQRDPVLSRREDSNNQPLLVILLSLTIVVIFSSVLVILIACQCVQSNYKQGVSRKGSSQVNQSLSDGRQPLESEGIIPYPRPVDSVSQYLHYRQEDRMNIQKCQDIPNLKHLDKSEELDSIVAPKSESIFGKISSLSEFIENGNDAESQLLVHNRVSVEQEISSFIPPLSLDEYSNITSTTNFIEKLNED